MATIKKAQKGIKATADSTLFFHNKVKDQFKNQADLVRKTRNTGISLDDVYKSKQFVESKKTQVEAQNNQKRQKYKGKPGYDANGFPKKKNGGSIAKDGKWIQKATASIKKRGTAGKCTPITKPGCTGKAKTLALTFKKMAKAKKKK